MCLFVCLCRRCHPSISLTHCVRLMIHDDDDDDDDDDIGVRIVKLWLRLWNYYIVNMPAKLTLS
jgi:hypothetical protein